MTKVDLNNKIEAIEAKAGVELSVTELVYALGEDGTLAEMAAYKEAERRFSKLKRPFKIKAMQPRVPETKYITLEFKKPSEAGVYLTETGEDAWQEFLISVKAGDQVYLSCSRKSYYVPPATTYIAVDRYITKEQLKRLCKSRMKDPVKLFMQGKLYDFLHEYDSEVYALINRKNKVSRSDADMVAIFKPLWQLSKRYNVHLRIPSRIYNALEAGFEFEKPAQTRITKAEFLEICRKADVYGMRIPIKTRKWVARGNDSYYVVEDGVSNGDLYVPKKDLDEVYQGIKWLEAQGDTYIMPDFRKESDGTIMHYEQMLSHSDGDDDSPVPNVSEDYTTYDGGEWVVYTDCLPDEREPFHNKPRITPGREPEDGGDFFDDNDEIEEEQPEYETWHTTKANRRLDAYNTLLDTLE